MEHEGKVRFDLPLRGPSNGLQDRGDELGFDQLQASWFCVPLVSPDTKYLGGLRMAFMQPALSSVAVFWLLVLHFWGLKGCSPGQ